MPTPKTMQCVSNEIETPGGSTLWIPEVKEDVKPYVGQVFNELEDAYVYYLRYAFAGRFGVRSSTQKRLKNKLVCEKHYICSKAGYPEKNEEDTLKATEIKTTKQKTKVRVSNIKVTGCTARLTVKLIRDGKFKVIKFMETHNHMMCLEEHKYMLKKARKLTFQQQQFIFKMGTMNIGPTKAHNIYKTLKGSYEDTSGTVVDFKNFRRDINAYIGGSDAQILVTKMLNKKNYVSDFSFEYKLEEGKLASLFWADEVAKANFKEFGDIVSFDATYSTNK